MQSIQGSLCYNGTKIAVYSGRQIIGNCLQVDLECKTIGSNARFAVLKMKNIGSASSQQITAVKTLDMEFSSKEHPLYHSLQGDSKSGDSFMPIDLQLNHSYHEEPTGGRSSNTTGFPYFDLSYDGKADVYAIGWTGQWSKDIFPTDNGFCVQIGLCDCDFYLFPGEEVRFPSVLMVRGDNPAATRRTFRRLLREEFSPKKQLGRHPQLPVAIQCFDRYFYAPNSDQPADNGWATEEGQIRAIDAAKKIAHIDTLWIDAAWFEKGYLYGVGNYHCDANFPNGLKPISDYAHQKGMNFVVWFEPERAYMGTQWHQKEDCLLKLDDTFPHTLVNLGDGGACERLGDVLVSLVKEYGIDVFRQDFNVDPLDFWRAADEERRKGITEMKYIAGLYKLWDRLLRTFPHLLIDNCASGGRRLDLEMCMRSVTLWRSDTGCHPEDAEKRITVWSINQILGLSEYIPYHACAVWDSDAYTVRSTATQGMACNFDIFDPDFDYETAKTSISEVQRLKHYWNGDFYPLSKATLEENVWSAYQLALEDSGAVYVFRREQSPDSIMTFALNAVGKDQRYCLTFTDEQWRSRDQVFTGQQLLSGLQICLDTPRSSMVITYKKVSAE